MMYDPSATLKKLVDCDAELDRASMDGDRQRAESSCRKLCEVVDSKEYGYLVRDILRYQWSKSDHSTIHPSGVGLLSEKEENLKECLETIESDLHKGVDLHDPDYSKRLDELDSYICALELLAEGMGLTGVSDQITFRVTQMMFKADRSN
jgi:hypothetical protein